MPVRIEDKPPQRTIRVENQAENMVIVSTPEVNSKEIYQDTITRNQTLSKFDDAGANFQKEGQLLFILCIEQGLSDAAEAVNALIQGDANVKRGIGGLTLEAVTTLTSRHFEKKESNVKETPKQIIGTNP